MPSHNSSQTLGSSSSLPSEDVSLFQSLPPIRVSSTHFDQAALAAFEDRLIRAGANLSWDASEASIVITRVERRRRAQYDLRSAGVETEEVPAPCCIKHNDACEDTGTARKRQKISNSSSYTTDIHLDENKTQTDSQHTASTASISQDSAHTDLPVDDPVLSFLRTSTVKVIKASWIDQCFQLNGLAPLTDFIVYEGVRVAAGASQQLAGPRTPPPRKSALSIDEDNVYRSPGEEILARAKAEAIETSPRRDRNHGSRRFGDDSKSVTSSAAWSAGAHSTQKQFMLLHETTSEHDGAVSDSELPPPPDWVTKGLIYACQRSTPPISPNENFIELLKDVRLARLLTDDQIGVRAYSTSIAALAAYPYKLSSAREVFHIPGCDVKIANLFVEYANTGKLHAAEAAKEDPELRILRLFYDIWGVGATTARDFYYQRGWKELDDVIEFGWTTLSRVQQIGVKFYDEFKDGIPRKEVEDIAAIIHKHAVKVRDSRVQSLVVGGYRRGKEASGDVDLIVSHPDESATEDLVTDIVSSLEDEGWITHTLLLALTSTHRGQQTLAFRPSKTQAGSGFDTLDKALVVWQDPSWEGEASHTKRDPQAKNPAPHRRVDIIISPWRTVGCAVMGWSGGTTFQRDVRRYVKNVKGWKFDSSGVRDRATGKVVDVEGYFDAENGELADGGRGRVEVLDWNSKAKTMVEAEKRVFESLGLEWKSPDERCTG